MPLGTFLNDGTALALHGVAWLALSESCHRVQGSWASDDAGGGSVTWGTAAGTIPCRIDGMGGGEADVAERISERATHTVTMPGFEPIEVEDRLAIDGRGEYVVLAVPEGTNTAEQVRTVEVMSAEDV